MRPTADSPIDPTNPLDRKEFDPPVCLIFTSNLGEERNIYNIPSLLTGKQQEAPHPLLLGSSGRYERPAASVSTKTVSSLEACQ